MLLSFLSALLSLCFFVCCIRFDRFRIGVLYALTSLCFCFPVYAEDEAYTFDSDITEFTYLQNNEIHLDQIENNIIQDEIDTQNEIASILAEPLASYPSLRSVNGDSTYVSLDVSNVGDDRFYFTSSYLGSYDPSDFTSFLVRSYPVNGNSTILYSSLIYSDIVKGHFTLPQDSDHITAIYHFTVDDHVYTSPSNNVSSFSLRNDQVVLDNFDFLDIISNFLSWILASFSVLTTWIIADSMAGVYAAIFLVGCVVAMLFRVLRST